MNVYDYDDALLFYYHYYDATLTNNTFNIAKTIQFALMMVFIRFLRDRD